MSSQNKDIEYIFCKLYLICRLINLTSGSKEIDDFIEKRQLEIKDHNDIVLDRYRMDTI